MIPLLKENGKLRTRACLHSIGVLQLCMDSALAPQLCTVMKDKVSCLHHEESWIWKTFQAWVLSFTENNFDSCYLL